MQLLNIIKQITIVYQCDFSVFHNCCYFFVLVFNSIDSQVFKNLNTVCNNLKTLCKFMSGLRPDMFSWYKYILKCHFVFFPPLGLWSGNFFLIAPFTDHCILLPFEICQGLLSYDFQQTN